MQGSASLKTAALLASLMSSTAMAGPQTLDEIVGNYRLSGILPGAPTCTLFLSADPSEGGWALYMDEGCVNPFGFTEQAQAWFADEDTGEIVFIDAQRQPLVRYRPTNEGSYVSGKQSPYPNLVLQFESPASPD